MNETKKTYYHRIVGDNKSKKIYIEREEASKWMKTAVKEIKIARNINKITARIESDTAKLLSISYYMFGGNQPTNKNAQLAGKKYGGMFLNGNFHPDVFFFRIHVPLYIESWIMEAMKLLDNYDHTKADWEWYLKFAKAKAIRSVITTVNKDEQWNNILNDLTEYIARIENTIYYDKFSATKRELKLF